MSLSRLELLDQTSNLERAGVKRSPGRPKKYPVRPYDNSVDRAFRNYPPEIKAKAYKAFLDGLSFSDCARAIEHPDPADVGEILIRRWAVHDKWVRPDNIEQSYMHKVETDRIRDPKKISSDIDELCCEMQKVAEFYVHQFIDKDGKVNIPDNFKTRDFTDMAAALRMIHETRIKLRKSMEPAKPKTTEGMGFLTLIQEASARRASESRKSDFTKEREAMKSLEKNEYNNREYVEELSDNQTLTEVKEDESEHKNFNIEKSGGTRTEVTLAELRARLEEKI